MFGSIVRAAALLVSCVVAFSSGCDRNRASTSANASTPAAAFDEMNRAYAQADADAMWSVLSPEARADCEVLAEAIRKEGFPLFGAPRIPDISAKSACVASWKTERRRFPPKIRRVEVNSDLAKVWFRHGEFFCFKRVGQGWRLHDAPPMLPRLVSPPLGAPKSRCDGAGPPQGTKSTTPK